MSLNDRINRVERYRRGPGVTTGDTIRAQRSALANQMRRVAHQVPDDRELAGRCARLARRLESRHPLGPELFRELRTVLDLVSPLDEE